MRKNLQSSLRGGSGAVTALALSLVMFGADPARAEGGAGEGPRAPAASACTVSNTSPDILWIHTSPSTSSFALGYLWPGPPGTGSSAPCGGGSFWGADGTPYSHCGGGDYYAAVDYFGVVGWVPYSCVVVTY
ncbi:hypothetical protein [Micromonospora sp. NBRC 101691]|uniref:hypothetical protein n=1 Tax=Micromonospora sp. NBRC 101691 TaxID=3032198 RepID=UPI0024A55CA8|nr:hypothetical protein [Micromonospora sp. NBRC 101691]GLY20974.1 hypothetical protein Misp04_07060 [Micromonospora sp. NBRC 101691]